MKKILNFLGVFGSVILTIVLTVLIFIFAILLNIKSIVSEKGMSNTFKRINFVETLKNTEDGTAWEDFKQLGETLNLSEEQFEQILENDKVKAEIGSYIGEVLSSSLNDKEVYLTKERIENFLNIAIDEYNKVSDTKISSEDRDKIVNSFDEEMISNMNEEFSSINLTDTVESENVKYIKLIDNILFGNYILYLLLSILIVIALIGLFRFSCYKWMSYLKISTLINGSLMLFMGLIVLLIPLQDLEILLSFKKILAINIFITSIILFILSIGLAFGKKYLRKYIDNKKSKIIKKTNEASEKQEEVNQMKEKNKKKVEFDKKTIIIIALILVLILVILFLIFGRSGSYTITFDTDGGTKITNIEVKNNEIVKLPDAPEKEGYKFVGWTNEDGKVITKGTKVTEDLTLKAEWISNDAEIKTVEFDTNGGNEIDNIIIENGKFILLPIDPIKEGYVFVAWVDEKGNFITENTTITNNIKLKAKWIKKGVKTVIVKFNTDGGNDVGNIVIEKGKIILLPITPTKEGYKFAGWIDEKGKEVTKDTIVNKDITIKATWKDPYTCPSDCTPIEDGSKCSKTSIKDVVVYTGCPSGTETVETFCSSHKRQVSIGFDEDQEFIDAGILCNGNPKNFCVDYNSRYTQHYEGCPSGYFEYTYSASGLDAEYGCAKKYDKGGSSCPSGYVMDNNKCTKTEIINCTAN